MERFLGFLTPWVLMIAVVVSAQKNFNQRAGLKSECLGNIMRLTLDKSLAVGSQLEIDAINGSQIIALNPGLAAKCGYSMESDPWGNTKIFTSLLNCFAENQADVQYSIEMRLRMYGERKSEEDVHEVSKTCYYQQWDSREILCDRNYMEVSLHRLPPEIEPMEYPEHDAKFDDQLGIDFPEDTTSEDEIWRMVFFTPQEKPMDFEDAQKAGYGVYTTPTRLVLRSPYNMPETYSENVAGVPMEVLKVTTYFKRKWSVSMLDAAAACPSGGLYFTEDLITWYIPRDITPLVLDPIDFLEMHMGIDGKRLNGAKMAAKNYTMLAIDSYIVMELPIGGPDGYYKSHAPDYQYHITYTIEPMLELRWRGRESPEKTRYKVLFPITTPLMSRPPHVIDYTVAEELVFDVLLGTFLPDVMLLNITFATGVRTIAEANARGFNVQEHRFPNGSKTFTLQVPFSDPVVLKHNPSPEDTTYSLPLTYGLLILPEQTPFSYDAFLQATRQDVVLPTVTGSCDQEKFYITVEYGNQGKNFETMLSYQELTPELAALYDLWENGTHMGVSVHFLSADVVFELVQSSSLRGRLHLLLLDSNNNWRISDFSLACSFPMTTIECFSNGTMTALAVKVESVPQLIPSDLTLKDPSCKPTSSNDRFAYFSFDVNSCGTTRTFFENFMIYENEISRGAMVQSGVKKQSHVSGNMPLPPVTEYRVKVSCYYMLNDTLEIKFSTKSRASDPFAQPGSGELLVRMRIAQDISYNAFYVEEVYPVVQYLRRPLYFEVELTQSTDPQIELVLENCWATWHEDRKSTPRWDIIVDGCENPDDRYLTTFHPVVADARVEFPAHLKRFEVKMFTFVRDEVVLQDQIFVHCDAVICDANKQTGGICRAQCDHFISMDNVKNVKRVRRSSNSDQHREQVSSGLILLSSLQFLS